MRILVVKTSSMGDILHTLPALTDAQRKIPGIQFDWVVEEGFSEIPAWHSAVNDVISFPFRRWRKNWLSTKQERVQFIQRLTAVKYDAIIDAQGLMKSAFFVVRLAKGLKHGYSFRTVREPLASLFYDVKHSVSKKQHAVERIRQLFAQSLGYTLDDLPGDYDIANHFARSKPQSSTPYVLFIHGTTRDDKHWPEHYWRRLIELMAPYHIKVKLPWGNSSEQIRAMRLAVGCDYVEVLPKSSLHEIARQLSGACAIVSVDTGLSHLSAALDRPNITLYGPTDPGLIGGYGKNQMACQVSLKMEDITPDHVFAQLKPLLQDK